MAAVVEALAQSWVTLIDQEAQSWESASLTAPVRRGASQESAARVVSVGSARQVGSWASHSNHQPLAALAATASVAVGSRWHAAGGVLDWERRVQTLGLSWAPGWDCQSSRAARPGRQCLVEPFVSACHSVDRDERYGGYLSLAESSPVENSYTGA